jgi:hypothetical protein
MNPPKNIHRGPKWFRNAQNSNASNHPEKFHQCVELDDSFPTMQISPQTEFVCKSYERSKFQSNQVKGQNGKKR